MSEPTTEAGRRLRDSICSMDHTLTILAIEQEARADLAAPPGTHLVLVAEGLLDLMGTRNERGDKLTFEWGEPDEHGWYTPVVTQHADDNLVRDLAARIIAAVEALPKPPSTPKGRFVWAYLVDRAAVLDAIREASDGERTIIDPLYPWDAEASDDRRA